MQFSDLGLTPELLKAIEEQGYSEPTPVQRKAIPPILLGRDVMAAAQTGTGKTASFTLPMLQRLKGHASTSVSPARHPVRALILAPTRELAAQVEQSALTYGKYIPLRVASVFGGVPIDPQIAALRAGVEILVATPGRLLDHIQSKMVMFHAVEFLVLDEADRMLDMGFLPDIKRIIAMLPVKRQTLLFSATYSDEIRKLAGQWLRDPAQVEVAPRNAVTESVTHTMYKVDSRAKRDALVRLLRDRDMKQVLVFCNTKIGANRLAYRLQKDDLNAAAIHSDRTQAERMQALAQFKEGKVRILVATDIAARGLDIEQLPFVVNFDMPSNPEDYVHRIGRTGRAGLSGEAISLIASEDRDYLAAVEKLIKKKLELNDLPTAARVTHKPARPASHGGDRLFHEPYVSAAASRPKPASDSKALGTVSNRKKQKQIAALFLPPVSKPDA
ncbi:MAG: DEAD/DEAH box helicase [Betaproteobacteria bacterium]|jgi:ATP-dependent RNA helicase RhlE|nr:MAG: DEAD/DEAH box helicase [Betaproteobacteria bacterium]